MCVYRYENSGRRSLVLVMFIGGVTFAEISALRFLNAQVKSEYCVLEGREVRSQEMIEKLFCVFCVHVYRRA